MLSLDLLLALPAMAFVSLLLFGCWCSWEQSDIHRAKERLAEDRLVAELDAIWELPAQERA